ncbi:MAG: hypothetical protein HDS02_03240 [Bacteroides sp.]|nr:hypothetical protein [Bacteroides sp.]
MDITEITTMLGTILGIITPLGGVGAWLYRKQNKRLKEAEAALAEANVSKAKVESKADEWNIWKEQLEAEREHVKFKDERINELLRMNAEKEDRHQQDIKDWEERFTNQTTYLRSVQRDLLTKTQQEIVYTKKIADLERERDYFKLWFCRREFGNEKCDPDKCGRREPQQSIPIKYIPLDELNKSTSIEASTPH